MDVDGKGFIVNGRRTYIASGSIHYPRVPKDLWHDRLLRLKRCGFNTVETYAFWNYHEPKENEFDFSGEKDFEGYLNTAQDLELYAIVRAGPYVCAEWDSGGYPIWAKFKPGVVVRKDNPAYLALQDHWLGAILPKVATHQISQGGNVILLQLENEGAWSGAWQGKASDPYYQNLCDNALKHGIEIPYFMSGFHHGSMPIPEEMDNSKRLCPWFSTEIWAGWYSNYGTSDYGFMRTLRCNAKILARGGNGHNYYMFHGGSNFASWNDNETAASYDYGATLGQAGDMRPVYVRLKANNFFAASFGDILGNATDATDAYQDFAANASVVGARKSPAGTVVFVQGKITNDDPAVLKSVGEGAGGPIHIPPQEIAPIVLDAPIAAAPDSIKIVQATARIFGLAHHDQSTTLILFGQPGDTGILTLALGGVNKVVNVAFPTAQPDEVLESVGQQTLRILSMSAQLADRTWIVGRKNKQYIVVGPEYVGDFTVDSGKPSLVIERPYNHPAPNKVIVYATAGERPWHLAVKADTSCDAAEPPKLENWQAFVPLESADAFDDASWKTSDDPLQMGADGDISAFAWYRAAVQSPSKGAATLSFPGAADHIVVFVNGKRCAATPSVVEPKPTSAELKTGNLSWTVQADLKAGRNTIAVLASHQGRDKAGGYYGPIDNYYPKGIFKPVSIELAGQRLEVTDWKMHGGLSNPDSLAFKPLPAASAQPTFYQAAFSAERPKIGPNPILRLVTAGLSRGVIYLNGRCIGRYPEVVRLNNEPLPVYLPECWLSASGKNSLVIFDEEGQSPAQVHLWIETAASREVIAVSKPAEPDDPITLPPYNPVSLRSCAQMDLALEKPITASSSAHGFEAANANDGDGMTAWSPATPPTPEKPAWIQVDLKSPHDLMSREIFWRHPGSLYPHVLEGSTDGKTWITLIEERPTDGALSEAEVHSRTGLKLSGAKNIRYLRLTITGALDVKKPLQIDEFRAWDVYHPL